MKNKKLYGTTFCGNEASDYAKEQGYLDYATLAKAFDAILNNRIMEKTFEIGYWDQENGIIDNSEEIEELQERIEEIEERQAELIEETEEYKTLQNELETIQEQIEELEEDQYNEPDIYQYFIISDEGARILKEYTDEIVFYNEELDMYVWGVTHCGTSWDYVLTDIKLNCGVESFED